MTLKDKILIDLAEIGNQGTLKQIFDFIQEIKQEPIDQQESNKAEVLEFVGKIDDDVAEEVMQLIDSEFNSIEGDW